LRSADQPKRSIEPDEIWPAQQLAEFLASVSAGIDRETAVGLGIERVAEALDAEVTAAVRDGYPIVSIGFPPGELPEAQLRDLARGSEGHTTLPGLGACAVAREPLDPDGHEWLLVARTGPLLGGQERDLLRGMGRVLGLALEMLDHRRLLEHVSGIQRQIVRRCSAEEVMESIVAGAAEVTHCEVAVMRRLDRRDPTQMVICAGTGIDSRTVARGRAASSDNGTTGLATQRNELVVLENYQEVLGGNPVMQADGINAAMAYPVHEFADVVGTLCVASRGPGRRFSTAEREALKTFAEHASMAITDAYLVEDALHRAMHDALTDLPNRALFSDRLEQALQRAERVGGHVAVLFLDIDRFKTVNDSLGHTAGDDLLVAAARRLRGCLRPGDTAARFGGDEFAVLVEDADEQTGRRLAERILRVFAEPFMISGRAVHLGASIGIALGNRPGDDPLRDGDLAMYRAKADGRGRHAVFQSSMRTAAQAQLELESELRVASDRAELFLEYQPIVELYSKQMTMVEALLRWRHPRLGLLAPDAFLPLAEETREIAALGRWVMHSACSQAMAWHALDRGQRTSVAVNVSPIQLHGSDIVTDVCAALAETGLPAESLILELTETVIMEDVAATIERLRQLKELGVGIAIDDFGTGYCSLQYLRRFPIDYLKIARPFIADLADPGADASLIRAITDLGGSFGLTVIAEGVEEPRQRERLIDIGCQLGQGYLFAAPLDTAGIELTLARQF
jgi:diguanylate cyclase (GGDEF)-like protein